MPPKNASAPNALATLAGPLPVLQPGQLDASTERAVHELLLEGESANTRSSYRSAARYWFAWLQLRYGKEFDSAAPLPVHVKRVVQFIVDHAERRSAAGKVLEHELPRDVDEALVRIGVKAKPGPMALNTLQHRLAALARLHRDRHLPSPTDHQDVRRLMRAVRSAYAKRGQLPKKKDALGLDHLSRLLATCDGTPQGVRDRALLLFAFDSGGRRRSEVAGADRALLKKDGDGFSYNLAFSKTNQQGADRPENHKPVVGLAADAMRAWLRLLAAAGIHDGAIFRRVRRGGHIGQEPLSDAAIWEIVTKRCKRAGLDAEGDFSAHSLRSGFMTEAAREGVPLKEMMAFSGHTDVKTALGYMQRVSMKDSAAAGLASRRKATNKESEP